MIDNIDAVKLLDSKRGNAVFVATMNANNVHFGLPTITSNEKLDFPISGAMSKASNVALGLALAQPDRKIFCLDGDGSLLMNLGSMVTISNTAPKNLIHVLFNNKVYAVTGGQPIPGAEKSDWEGMAKSAGYANVFSFDNLEDLTNGIDEAMAAVGPVFIHLVVKPEIENTPVQFRTPAKRNVHTAIADLPETLGVKR
ncbi:MAG: thiamine pyrophosphate-binding protein [SAR202 cluster bacterium]|nr:thiamine pyrophosphate-binding protein [SAR202 cluster bacterium]